MPAIGSPGTLAACRVVLPAWSRNRYDRRSGRNFVNFKRRRRSYMPWEKMIAEPKMLSKEYQETARTLLRIAGSMTDQTIVERLKGLAENYKLRALEASRKDVEKPFPVSTRTEAREA